MKKPASKKATTTKAAAGKKSASPAALKSKQASASKDDTESSKRKTASKSVASKNKSAATSSPKKATASSGKKSTAAPSKKSATKSAKPTSPKATAKKSASPKSGGRSSKSASGSKSGSSKKSTAASSPREGLQDVLKDLMKDIYYAEKQLVKALKKMNKAATNQQLKDAFMTHLEQTNGQIEKLESAFEMLGLKAQGKKCPAMDGLIEEGDEHMSEMDKGHALDAALIVGAQKVEHYEIAAYGSLRTFARSLGFDECTTIFQEILDQEAETDELLTGIAQTVNQEALMADEDKALEEDSNNDFDSSGKKSDK